MNIRFGIIGTSWIADSFLAAASAIESFKATAVYSRNEETARTFADKHELSHTFTSIEAMAVSPEIDAVYIASPNALHAEHAILFLQQGKHVLCEKPLAANAYEVEQMIAAANKSGAVLMEAMKSTLLPGFKLLQQNLHKIGKVRKVSTSYCQYSSRYDKYKEGIVLNAFRPELANGALMDIGIYCLYPLIVLFGEPVKIAVYSYMLDSGVDGEGSMILTYPDMGAALSYSKITNSYVPSEIQGEEGSILIDKIYEPTELTIRYRDGRTEQLTADLSHPPMYYEAREFVELITNGERESTINSHTNSLASAKVIDEARAQIGLVFPNDDKRLNS